MEVVLGIAAVTLQEARRAPNIRNAQKEADLVTVHLLLGAQLLGCLLLWSWTTLHAAAFSLSFEQPQCKCGNGKPSMGPVFEGCSSS